MAAKQADQKSAEQNSDTERMLTLIGANVVRTLGAPTTPHKILVHSLWADRFRVNVMVGVDTVSAVVAHSFFVVADNKGNIVLSTPEIRKSY